MVARALFVFLLLLAATPAQAGERTEKAAVIAAVQAFFDALESREESRILASLVPEGSITGHGMRGGVQRSKTQSWRQWMEGIRGGKERLVERMHKPKVRVRGTMASLWTTYTFHIDGKFSHCGYDSFDLAKVDGRWKVVNLSFTAETEGCKRR